MKKSIFSALLALCLLLALLPCGALADQWELRWDLSAKGDLTLTGSGAVPDQWVQSDSGRQDPLNWGHDDYPLMSKVLANSEWKEMYKGYLRELCGQGGLFSWELSHARILAWQDSIRDYVSNDTGEDIFIMDMPAYWGNHYEYRIMEDCSDNFFKVKSETVAAMK